MLNATHRELIVADLAALQHAEHFHQRFKLDV